MTAKKDFVEAASLKKLSASHGGKHRPVAEALGLTDSAIGSYLREGKCPPHIELACKYLLAQLGNHDTTLLVLELNGTGLKSVSRAKLIGTNAAGKHIVEAF